MTLTLPRKLRIQGLSIALRSLQAHKIRALLAMLGVFLGALALTAVMHIAEAMVFKADLETRKLGPNLIQAISGQVRFKRSGSMGITQVNRNFTLADATALIQGIAQVHAGVPYAQARMPVRHGRLATTAQMVATLPEFTQVRAYSVEYGTFFSASDEENKALVCVLGNNIATRLFSTPEAALGKTVRVYRASLRVIGVMEEKGRDLSGDNLDEQVYVPLSTFMRRMANQDWISGVYMNLHDGAHQQDALNAARTILRINHSLQEGEKDDFSVVSAQNANKLRKEALGLVQTLGILSSSISFTVGSLGILSIMTLLVRARRLEIGIRRAVGASRHAIIRQFLTEAGIMAGVGGIMGVVMALLVITCIYIVGDFPMVYNINLILGASLASIGLGLVAGAYPAWQASNVNVLDILR